VGNKPSQLKKEPFASQSEKWRIQDVQASKKELETNARTHLLCNRTVEQKSEERVLTQTVKTPADAEKEHQKKRKRLRRKN